jgi:hypothetical protein
MVLEGEVRSWVKCCGVAGLSEREVVGKNIHARVNLALVLAGALEQHVTV